MLYPLKFHPIFKEVLWGGCNISRYKNLPERSGIGESWEISGLENYVSVVSAGPLEGKTLMDLLDICPRELMGCHVYERFGKRFPILVKFVDAAKNLSIQVHPDDATARRNHGPSALGKAEMWYVMDTEPDASLISGFSQTINKEDYERRIRENDIESVLAHSDARPGDVFFIPPGRVHSIGKGILLAEIQRASDFTYRLYDYNRRDSKGQLRELHTELASEVLDYVAHRQARTFYEHRCGTAVQIVDCTDFVTNLIELDRHPSEAFLPDNDRDTVWSQSACPYAIDRDMRSNDSFCILVGVDGEAEVQVDFSSYRFFESIGQVAGPEEKRQETMVIRKGETLLIPAALTRYRISTSHSAKLLEAFVY